jgi:hypothetical protein
MATTEHEIIRVFKEQLYPLSEKMTEMLNEHHSHQTERRGCGYTQATRVLAEYINSPRRGDEFFDLKLFDQYDTRALRKILEQKNHYNLNISGWQNLLNQAQVHHFLEQNTHDDYAILLKHELDFQARLQQLSQVMSLEESRLIADLIADIILPKDAKTLGLTELHNVKEKPKVGSCPMAENFFLKIAHRHVLRQGEINIFVNEANEPLLLEKMNMGDNHSCISLQPVILNGVRLPAGSLFSVDYDPKHVATKRQNKEFHGSIIPYTAISGFWFLRLTTLAVSPQNRKRAFSTHYEQQVANGLYSPGTTELQQLIDVARAQI